MRSIRENGQEMDIERVKGFSSGRMEPSMKAIGRTTRPTELAGLFTQTETTTWENGSTIKRMEEVDMSTLMEQSTLETGEMTASTVLELSYG